jgi:asparagine synthase (glutamine-hydrolysing)
MCGISGIITRDGSQVPEDRIRRITDLVAHRGPDDFGFHFADGLALGHRRLAIIDLNPRGRQPMEYGGRYRITYNGEVYNYLEIRRELEARGVRFRTTTDTEVIVAAYAEWGSACLQRFNGMWAFAIHDSVDRRLFLARDRFGVKPLYYLDGEREFAFGSELKQLVALQPRARANHWAVVESLLTYVDGHTDQTFFADVRQLPPSHCMVYDLATHRHSITRWYELRTDDRVARLPLPDAVAEFRQLLDDSVRLRLRSDVKVGTCLSGGLDSSATSALASGQYRAASGQRFTGIHAKSIESRTDESAWARRVADHADIDLAVVEPSTDDFIATVDEVVYTQEEPFGSPSMFMGWHVFREARARDCRVMLNGQGGDEVLLGYERYYAAILRTVSCTRFLREAWLQSRNSRLGFAELLQFYAYFTNADLRIRRLKGRSRLKAHIRDAHDFEYVRRSADSFRSVADLQKFEICTLQLPHLLRYEDRNSMRHSIETRLPFLDYRLVEAAVSLPWDYKVRGGWTKFVLREAVRDVLPDDVVWRRDKLGFEAPERVWLTAYAGRMKKEVAESRILDEIADKRRLLVDFDRLSLKERWAYFNLAAWERVYDVAWE